VGANQWVMEGVGYSCGTIRRRGGNVPDLQDKHKISLADPLLSRTGFGLAPSQDCPAMYCWLGGLPEKCRSHYNWTALPPNEHMPAVLAMIRSYGGR
jgi:hypothetical protein